MSQPSRACPQCHTPLPGVAAFCYVCGTATPVGTDRATGQRIAVTITARGSEEMRRRLQRALGPGYELGERIGMGGFAEVYRAQDLRLKRPIAIKVLHPELGDSAALLERFRREAEVIAALRHPGIVPIFDFGEGEGLVFLIMPFIEGESLRERIERTGALPPAEVIRILQEASAGLAAAHGAGVIHRDIKPENIMLEGSEARVLLMDFGIAKAVETDDSAGDSGSGNPGLTSTGIVVGTPQYMSPEQAAGDRAIDAATDQYSLAVVGFRMLTGKLPFQGDSTRAVLYQQLVGTPPAVRTVAPGAPAGLAAAIDRALLKEPKERFSSMKEFAEAIVAAPAAPRGGASGRTAILGIAAVAALCWLIYSQLSLPTGRGSNVAVGDSLPPSAETAAAPSVPPQAAGSQPIRRNQTTASLTTPPPGETTSAGTTAAGAPAPAASSSPSCDALAAAGRWSEALAACTDAAGNGSVIAMRTLAGMHDRGNGVPANPSEAVVWYRRAADRDPESSFQLSRLYEIGRGVPRDLRASQTWLRQSAEAGHIQGMMTLAFRLENGAGMNRDWDEAARWYLRSAEAGDVNAMLKMAEWSGRGRGMPRNPEEAVRWYARAGERGSAEGAWQAAQAYLKGQGVAADEATAITHLRRAAELGHRGATDELGRLNRP